MEKLYLYFYDLPVTEREAYARRCKTSAGYLQKALYAWKAKNKTPRFDGELARLLDENSNGFVPRQELRPDIWPELVTA